jgi:large subunit ribosomal protein L24
MRLREGDTVQVVSGADKGRQGKVLRILGGGRVLVEGVNRRKKHMKPSQKNPKGGIVSKEGPIHACKVMPLDPESGKPTRVGSRVEGGKKVRVALRSGKPLPFPAKE